MDQTASPQATLLSTVFIFALVGVMLFFRMRRLTQERPLKLEQLWIVPGIYLVIAGLLFYATPPRGMALVWCGGALLIGAMLGWQRGRMMHIKVDPETQTLRQKGSMAAMLFLIALIVLRTGARELAILGGSNLHIDVVTITDALVAMALGLLSVQRIEMYLRAKRLLEEAGTSRA